MLQEQEESILPMGTNDETIINKTKPEFGLVTEGLWSVSATTGGSDESWV